MNNQSQNLNPRLLGLILNAPNVLALSWDVRWDLIQKAVCTNIWLITTKKFLSMVVITKSLQRLSFQKNAAALLNLAK